MDNETLNDMYRMIGETRYFIHDFNIHVGKVTSVRKEHEKFLVSICDGETEQEHQVSLSDIEHFEETALRRLKIKLSGEIIRLTDICNELFPEKKEEKKDNDPLQMYTIITMS
ncbi:hypothetical protein KKF82_06520 [Patescibacteria group bacterium]|nr:hypothetical protein [Patescibacteria group bacterium]